MKAVIGRCLLALVLFGAGAICWAESSRARRMADAYERLATLHYDLDEGLAGEKTLTDRLPASLGSLRDEARRHDATVQYWLSRYDGLTAPLRATAPGAESDPELLFVAANAAFRASQLAEQSTLTVGPRTERSGTALAPRPARGALSMSKGARQVSRGPSSSRSDQVKRLDSVLQAYATVLKATPRHPDAAYNYEYVVRVRDALAGARPASADRGQMSATAARRATDDLPAGPTLHGRPGAPPPAARVDEFEILAPMLPEERESTQPKASPGVRPERKG